VNAISRYLGVDETWERPGPTPAQRRIDLWLAVVWLVVGALGLELLRSIGAMDGEQVGVVGQYAALVTGTALLVWRRTHPLTVASLAAVHMLAAGIALPMVMSSLPMQVLYFFALFSGVAWSRDRRMTGYVVTGVVVLMFCWLAWLFALGDGVQNLQSGFIAGEGSGLFPAVPASVAYIFLNNVMYFGGAILLGQIAWRAALRTAQVQEQASTIAEQSGRLRDQAVVAERLRIARELHDVVAHHVSVMGVQAAAARRVLDRDPAAARAALEAVEGASREAVGQMRELLGTLRSGELAADATPEGENGDGRAPQPTLADLPVLVDRASTPVCAITCDLVEERPGQGADVPPPVQLSAYRVVQESLANVHRHSTATRASVVVRVGSGHVEVEVVDNGRPRSGTAGTGLGHLGIRERAHHLGGTAEIGPRHDGSGYRVRVRFPLAYPVRTPSAPVEVLA
jgi:signal transduction histidine kinase